jgi:hypothetical protein
MMHLQERVWPLEIVIKEDDSNPANPDIPRIGEAVRREPSPLPTGETDAGGGRRRHPAIEHWPVTVYA